MTDRTLMKRYLLGTASADERTALEKKYLSDAEVFEELTAAENDLLDSYTRDQLSNAEKREFEKRYMASPEGRTRAEFSRALAKISSESRQTPVVRTASFWEAFRAYFQLRSPVFQWGLLAACAAIFAVAIGSRYFVRNRDLQAGLRHQQTQNRQAVPPQTTPIPSTGTAETEIAKAERLPFAEFTMQLDPGVSRTVGSGAPKAFVVPSHTQWLNLQLAFDGNIKASNTAVVETAEGREVRRILGLKSHSVFGKTLVAMRLPVRLIPAGDYVVDLRASGNSQTEEESVESYTFRVLYK